MYLTHKYTYLETCHTQIDIPRDMSELREEPGPTFVAAAIVVFADP